MLARDSERLEELNPLNMPCVILVLAINIGQRLVLRMEYKRLGLELMIPML